MDHNLSESTVPRSPSPDAFHILNNQLQILLVSAERLRDLTAYNQEAKKECSAVQMSARKIAELIGILAKASTTEHSSLATQQEWQQMQAHLAKNKQEAGV